jgi:hypothetical protein
MKIERTATGTFLLHASADEMLLLNNAVNEICYGLEVPEFEIRIGVSLAEAQSVLREIGKALDRDVLN